MEITIQAVEAALAKVTDDVYEWAFGQAYDSGKYHDAVWEDLVALVCCQLGLKVTDDDVVNDILNDLVDTERFTSEAEWGEIEYRTEEEPGSQIDEAAEQAWGAIMHDRWVALKA